MARDLSRSWAILIGNGKFADHEKIPQVPASSCVAGMLDLLTGELCGWPRDRISLFVDLPNPADVARGLVRAVRGAEDVLLVYYVGHGMLTMKGDLVLAVGDTEADPEALPHTAMPYGSVASIMRGSSARTKLVILDCCYAETANQANFGTQSAGLTDAYPVDGLYFIGASKRREKAGFPLHGDLTYFTEAFIDTVRTGIGGQSPAPELTLSEIFRVLRDKLAAAGLPEPADSGIRDARQYPFALNAAHRAMSQHQATADPAREARRRIIGQAERAAAEISREERSDRGQRGSEALLAIAAAVVVDDPDYARRLIAQAMRLAGSSAASPHDIARITAAMAPADPERAKRLAAAITDAVARDYALAEVAQIAAAIAPDCAERAANAIDNEEMRESSLAEIAETLATTRPEQAERIAGTISVPWKRASVLAKVGAAVAASDLRRAESIANAISADVGGSDMGDLVRAVAAADLKAAERIALSFANPKYRDDVLEAAAEAAAIAPDRAMRLVAAISDPKERGWAGYLVASSHSEDDPGLAESIARAISDPYHRVLALTSIVWDVAKTDPTEAARVASEAEELCHTINDRAARDKAVQNVARSLATVDAEHAARVAETIVDAGIRDEANRTIAAHAVAGHSRDAREIAASIGDLSTRARALEQAAGVAASHGNTTGACELLREAERVARTIADPRERAFHFAYLADQLAAVDRDHAKRALDEAEILARTIPDGRRFTLRKPSDETLAAIVAHIVRFGTPEAKIILRDHAERIARSIHGFQAQAEALTIFAEAVFCDDRERAERAVMAISNPEEQLKALIRIAAMH